MPADASLPGVILAGGESRRLAASRGKSRIELGGRILLQHVIDRLGPQVDELWLSVSAETRDAAPPGLALLPDRAPSHRGPLSGLSAALARLEARGGDCLILSPCDTPFLPRDLAARLRERLAPGVLAVVAADEARIHPACSAWSVQAASKVATALADPRGPGLMALLDGLEHRVVRWPAAEPPPFLNVNTPEDLAAAGRWLERS